MSASSQKTPQKPILEPSNAFTVKRPRLLNFSDKKGKVNPEENMENEADEYRESKVLKSIRNMRRIQKTPYKVLDAPGLTDDFY